MVFDLLFNCLEKSKNLLATSALKAIHDAAVCRFDQAPFLRKKTIQGGTAAQRSAAHLLDKIQLNDFRVKRFFHRRSTILHGRVPIYNHANVGSCSRHASSVIREHEHTHTNSARRQCSFLRASRCQCGDKTKTMSANIRLRECTTLRTHYDGNCHVESHEQHDEYEGEEENGRSDGIRLC